MAGLQRLIVAVGFGVAADLGGAAELGVDLLGLFVECYNDRYQEAGGISG